MINKIHSLFWLKEINNCICLFWVSCDWIQRHLLAMQLVGFTGNFAESGEGDQAL